IRPAIAYRPGETIGTPPAGAADDDGFVVTVAMTSLAGCSGEDFASILRGLGYQSKTRDGVAITKPILLPAATEPVKPVATAGADESAAQPAAPASEGDVIANGVTTSDSESAGAEAGAVPVAAENGPVAAVEAAAAAPEAPPEPPSDASTAALQAPDAVAADGEAATGETAETAAPATVEIWTLARQLREHQHRPRHGHRDRAGGDRPPRQGGRPHHGGPRDGAPAGEGQPQESAGQQNRSERRDFRPRFNRDDKRDGAPREGGERQDGQKKPFQKKFGAPGGAFGKTGGPGGGGDARGERSNRDFRKRDDKRRDDGPRIFASAAPPRDKKADPDSPFAKLAALKAKMEGKE
ncbi:MAG: hypothetical protein ACRCYS_19520, partial [Beijerinckiaceae bacterium]